MDQRPWRPVAAMTAAVALQAACGSDRSVPPMPTPSAVVAQRALLYSLDSETLRVSEVAQATGLPMAVGSLAVPQARHVAVDPRGRFVYVSGEASRTSAPYLRSYTVSGDGTLRPASESLGWAGTTQLVGADGYVALVVDCGSDHDPLHCVTASAVDAAGTLKSIPEGGPPTLWGFGEVSVRFLPGISPTRELASYVLDQDDYTPPYSTIIETVRVGRRGIKVLGHDATTGGFDYVACSGSAGGDIVLAEGDSEAARATALSVLAADPANGRLSLRSRVPWSGPSCSLTASPSGKWIALLAPDSLSLYSLLAGQLTRTDLLPLSAAPPSGGSMAFHPADDFLYVSLAQGLTTFQIDAAGRLNELGSPFAPAGEVAAGTPPS